MVDVLSSPMVAAVQSSSLTISLSAVVNDSERVERQVLAFLNGRARALAPFCIAVFTDEAFFERDKDERELDFEDIVIFWARSLELGAHLPRLSFYILSFQHDAAKKVLHLCRAEVG